MKYELTKILRIECTLSSSEAIIFTKGGLHSLNLKTKEYDDEDDDWHKLNLDFYDFIEISFQIERDQQSQFENLTIEAMKHRGMWDEINAQSKEEAKKRMAAYTEQMNNLKSKPQTSEEPSVSSKAQE
jgi:hypothetical protein